MVKIRLDKKDKTPVYRQLIDQIIRQISEGTIKPGEKLPAERDLAGQLGMARGTVKKAYEEVARKKLITASQGKGSFAVSAVANEPKEKPPSFPGTRQKQAEMIIDNALSSLQDIRFSFKEIQTLFDMRIMAQEERISSTGLCVIDCNPEALSMFEKQITAETGVAPAQWLISDLINDKGAVDRLRQFDLIITTTTHYQDMLKRFPSIREQLVPAAVSPSRDALFKMARLKPTDRILVFCESSRFFEIISHHLFKAGMEGSKIRPLYFSEAGRLGTMLKETDVVITLPGLNLQKQREDLSRVQSFMENGGVLIPFDYRIEQGSLLHIEERLKNILEARK